MNDVMLKNLRNEIDNIDNIISQNILKRFKLTNKIGKYKLDNGIDIFDKKREKNVFENVIKYAKNDTEVKIISSIYDYIMQLSKDYQQYEKY